MHRGNCGAAREKTVAAKKTHSRILNSLASCQFAFFAMRRTFLLIILGLVVATLAAFWQVGSCGFVTYDDPSYVQYNPMVNQGLRSAAILWALSATHGANWHPLTSFSHMLDCTLFDLNPVPMHWENLLLHVLNVVLVLVVWQRLTAGNILIPLHYLLRKKTPEKFFKSLERR